ncbi:MAG: hypothetical protein ABS42_00300 [Bdellovibrio sp. SCN 50-8]|nr:MAG: hypothetical protein ABS42_00300 [Bdellovibrio sp. SCN 50-8]
MSKELDPSLFGEGAWASPRSVEKAKPNFDAVAHVEQKVADLRMQNRELQDELRRLASSMEEYKNTSNTKFERLAQQVARLEGLQGKVHQEVTTRVSQIHSRLGERQSMDLKIQEMMDRHQAMLRSAEMRMQQMQKLLNEKEAQAMSAQMALNDARIEIAKLKRL